MTFALDNDRLFRGAFLLVRDKANRPLDPEDLSQEAFYRNLCKAFREGQKSGQFKPFDPAMMAQFFFPSTTAASPCPSIWTATRLKRPRCCQHR